MQAAVSPKPAYVAICNTCGFELEWKVVSGNTKGNQGRWYAKCSKLNDQGKPECFKWGSPKPSPSNSPPLTASGSPTLPASVGEQEAVGFTSNPTCAIPNCTSTRVAVGCEHHCCREHCVALGGCTLRKHRPTPTEQKRYLPIDPALLAKDDSAAPALLPMLSTAADALLASTDRAPLKPMAQTKERDVDVLASTRHPSQMPAVFTQGYAQQEVLRQQAQAIQTERRALERAVANTIDAYGWHTNGHDSSSLQVQQGVTFPNFRVTSTILIGLGLTSGNDGEHLIQYFNPLMCRWTNIFQGHVTVLQAPQIHLRNLGITEMPDFDSIIAQTTAASSNPREPHLRHNLPSERSSVRRADHQLLIKKSRTPSLSDAIDSETGSDGSNDEPRQSAFMQAQKQEHNAHTKSTRLSPFGSSTIPDSGLPSPRSDDPDSEPYEPIPARVWPRDFYTVEVAEVFNAASAPGINARQAFVQTYGSDITFRPSTFSEHLKRWNASPITSRMEFIEAGQTDQGKYALFMKANPSPNGEVKAARKRLTRSNKN